jgi:hypothetical protein
VSTRGAREGRRVRATRVAVDGASQHAPPHMTRRQLSTEVLPRRRARRTASPGGRVPTQEGNEATHRDRLSARRDSCTLIKYPSARRVSSPNPDPGLVAAVSEFPAICSSWTMPRLLSHRSRTTSDGASRIISTRLVLPNGILVVTQSWYREISLTDSISQTATEAINSPASLV